MTRPEEGGQTIDATMRRILRDFPQVAALCVEEEVCLTLPAHPARLVLTPQYAPRAVSQPGGPHGEGAPWVMSLSNFVSDEEAEADSGG